MTFCHGPLSLCEESHDVQLGAKMLQLTPSEFKILLALMKTPGIVLSRERLADLIAMGSDIGDRSIDTHIFTLRRKLGKHRRMIETVLGYGYRFRHRED